MRLSGKVALVTGSARGIGRAVAVRLAHEGADVVLNDYRPADGGAAARAAVEAAGRKAHVVLANVAHVAEVRQLVDEAQRQFGRLDILVNNAGVEVRAPFTEAKEEDYDRVLGVNLKGVFFLTQAFARALIAAGRPGKVINISSVHEEIPFPGCASYCAAKGGVRMLTRDLAMELAPHRITVNGIAPGAIETEINRPMLDDPARKAALLKQIPLGRLGRPEDVAGLAAFLASDDADYVTASTYFVDGGLTWFYEE
jgi:glucose 1-dehydrogenase